MSSMPSRRTAPDEHDQSAPATSGPRPAPTSTVRWWPYAAVFIAVPLLLFGPVGVAGRLVAGAVLIAAGSVIAMRLGTALAGFGTGRAVARTSGKRERS